jgi:hypothetical protein
MTFYLRGCNRLKTLLFGNGINIQFGGTDNLSKSIILRAIKNTKEADFPAHIIVDAPSLIVSLLGHLFLQVREILNGGYDSYAYTTDLKVCLDDFKWRYSAKKSLNVATIGFEDYYLLYDLMCYKYKIKNPDKYHIREALKCFFLYSIFNKDRVNQIYKNYPAKLNDFFNVFDELYTTNYDNNVEVFSAKKVNYLHGAFHIKADVYNPDSMRNKMSDSPIKDCIVDDRYYYLYSNALTTYSGYSKMFSIKQHGDANSAMEKMAKAYQENEMIKDAVNAWEKDANEIVRKMAEGIKLKLSDSSLEFKETYPIKEFAAISDELCIVGLSPNNDTHIFNMINDNGFLKSIIYYFYDSDEIAVVSQLLNNHRPEFVNVTELWSQYR